LPLGSRGRLPPMRQPDGRTDDEQRHPQAHLVLPVAGGDADDLRLELLSERPEDAAGADSERCERDQRRQVGVQAADRGLPGRLLRRCVSRQSPANHQPRDAEDDQLRARRGETRQYVAAHAPGIADAEEAREHVVQDLAATDQGGADAHAHRDEAFQRPQRRLPVVVDETHGEDPGVEAPQRKPSQELARRIREHLVVGHGAMQSLEPGELDQVAGARQHHEQTEQQRRVHVPTAERCRGSLLPDRGPIARGDPEVKRPQRQQHGRGPGALAGGETIEVAAIERGLQDAGERDREGDRSPDRHHQACPIDVEAADGRGPLSRIAECVAPGEPVVHSPDRQGDESHRAEARGRRSGGISGGIVEDKKEDCCPEQRQPRRQRAERRRADEVEVEAPQSHAANRTTMRA
jgi:hypothetical protein